MSKRSGDLKTVDVSKDYQFKLGPHSHVQYRAGITYKRVPEIQAQAIIKAKAGRLVEEMPSVE